MYQLHITVIPLVTKKSTYLKIRKIGNLLSILITGGTSRFMYDAISMYLRNVLDALEKKDVRSDYYPTMGRFLKYLHRSNKLKFSS